MQNWQLTLSRMAGEPLPGFLSQTTNESEYGKVQ